MDTAQADAYLCDTFLENSKAIFDENAEAQKESAKQTLYTAIEGLWQRLPRRKGDMTPSITIAVSPDWNRLFDDPAAEAEYGLLVDILHSPDSQLNSLPVFQPLRKDGRRTDVSGPLALEAPLPPSIARHGANVAADRLKRLYSHRY
ncbi:hypothetical protein HBH69_219610 [Parastagonospora nodorum]|nr:hypothetical protein HBH69_219610 [Parastagonospora nodorum]KAH6383533.1 hypothetical protein HBI08_212830 [Parastagonospora nodorum]